MSTTKYLTIPSGYFDRKPFGNREIKAIWLDILDLSITQGGMIATDSVLLKSIFRTESEMQEIMKLFIDSDLIKVNRSGNFIQITDWETINKKNVENENNRKRFRKFTNNKKRFNEPEEPQQPIVVKQPQSADEDYEKAWMTTFAKWKNQRNGALAKQKWMQRLTNVIAENRKEIAVLIYQATQCYIKNYEANNKEDSTYKYLKSYDRFLDEDLDYWVQKIETERQKT